MARLKKVAARVQSRSRYKTPRRIDEIATQPTKGSPRRMAESLLARMASELEVDPAQVRFDKVKKTLLGSHVLFQQHHNGTPISGAWLRIDIDPAGKVYNVQSDLVPLRVLGKKAASSGRAARTGGLAARTGPATSRVTQERAETIAANAVKETPAQKLATLETEWVYYPHEGVPVEAWKIVLRSERPVAEWKVYVNGQTGAVLERVDLLRDATGRGRVFDPHPVAALNDTSLEDTSTVPATAYREVELGGLTAGGRLDGAFVTTKRTANRVRRTSRKFLFQRGQNGFKEVMVYFHIDRLQRYLQQLGFDNILNGPIEVDVSGTPDDNSFYSPSTKSLSFGTGGVDDAEDGEIILHEYGHAIQDSQVPGFGPSGEARAMGEGFGDYLAGSSFFDRKPSALRPCVGSWDAVAYSGDEPPNLRRLDSNKKYPRDIVGEEHADGEIWSACLWSVRAALGREATDRLVIAHHFLMGREASFEDAAFALLTVDQQLNEGRGQAAIRDVFVRRGILPNAKRKNRRAGLRFEDTTPRRRGRARPS